MKSSQPPPRYPYRPIRQPITLAKVLGVPLPALEQIAATSDSRYRLAKAIVKPDGSIRQPFDALEPLKDIQRRIKQRILAAVVFPDYLTGSLKGKDARKNAELHERTGTVLCEDVEGFFPNTNALLIDAIWRGFFGFSSEVASLLTQLTTKDGSLPQGAITSSHLANLAFWRTEHSLYLSMSAEGLNYSRYVDDITISSSTPLSNDEITRCIARVYGMMLACGYKAKRKKQEIQRSHLPMRVTKLNVNRRAAIPAADRHAIRAAVYQLEELASTGDMSGVSISINSVAGRVNRLGQMHAAEAMLLKERITTLRAVLSLQASASLEHQSAADPFEDAILPAAGPAS